MFILIRGLGLNHFQTCFCSASAYISTDANISYFNWQFCVANIINLEFYMTLWKRLHCNSLVKLHFYDKVDVTLLQWKDAYIFWGVLLQWETAKHEQLLFFFCQIKCDHKKVDWAKYIIGIVHKVYERSSCPVSKMILPWSQSTFLWKKSLNL